MLLKMSSNLTFRPLPQNFIIRPVMDVAYSVKLGAEVRGVKYLVSSKTWTWIPSAQIYSPLWRCESSGRSWCWPGHTCPPSSQGFAGASGPNAGEHAFYHAVLMTAVQCALLKRVYMNWKNTLFNQTFYYASTNTYFFLRQPFEDAVEAFKHIRDAHLKPLQTLKQSEAFPCNSLLEASVKVSSSTLEMKQTTGVTGKRVGESLVTLNKRMRVGNWILLEEFKI